MWILFNFVSVCITPCVPGLANTEIMNIVKELCSQVVTVFKKASAFCAKAQGALRRQPHRHAPPRRGYGH